MISKPLVTICTVTFNHENYIEKMLQSILEQKTNFDYELLIHDDASTDKTADIIKNYTIKYPNIIKPIFQKENQFSQGIRPNIEYNIPRAEGKYLAFCDGDDYWCDPFKLQKQVDFLEINLKFSGCTHNTRILRGTVGNQLEEEVVINSPQKDVYAVGDFTKGEVYFHTSAFLFRFNENQKNYILNLLKQIRGDWFRSILFASFGPIKYIDEVMSVYRIHDKGVWSELSSQEQLMKNLDAILRISKVFDYKYENDFLETFIRVLAKEFDKMQKKDIENLLKTLNVEIMIKMVIKLFESLNEKNQDLLKKEKYIQEKHEIIKWYENVVKELQKEREKVL